ncbi:MAG TPA: STAS domain-containing protein [Desulfitobacteriaceae bacterium]|nr:STAS domain-containing protein [Desulfitobacteriaceae bacterium]
MTVPIIKLGHYLIITIQTELTDDMAVEAQNKILSQIRESEAKGILVDLSIIDVIDSFMGRVLNDTAMMARLMGAQTVVAGIQPGVAVTFMELGLKMKNVHTVLDIEQGLELLKSLE